MSRTNLEEGLARTSPTSQLSSAPYTTSQEVFEWSSQSSSNSLEQTVATSQPSQDTQSSHSSYAESGTSLGPPRTPKPGTALNCSVAVETKPAVKHGSKRTANGKIKPSTPVRGDDSPPTTPSSAGLQRRFSSGSAGRTGELSACLKARLSYAMIKVYNGWESRTIDEVEQLASQMTSPVTPRHAVDAYSQQREGLSGVMDRSRELNAVVSDSPAQPHVQQREPDQVPPTDRIRPSHDLQGAILNPTPPRACYATSSTLLEGGAIRSRRPNWERNHNAKPAPILGAQPEVPTARPMTGVSAPTAEEQDAADMLVFMSSPANSAGFGPGLRGTSTSISSVQTSPTRSAFLRPSRGKSAGLRGFDFDDANGLLSAESDNGNTRNLGQHHDSVHDRRRLRSTSSDSPQLGDSTMKRLLRDLREYDSLRTDATASLANGAKTGSSGGQASEPGIQRA